MNCDVSCARISRDLLFSSTNTCDEAVDDPLRVFGRGVDEAHLVGCRAAPSAPARAAGWRGAAAPPGVIESGSDTEMPPRSRLTAASIDAVLIEVLEARGALEHRAAEQLLRDGAHALLAVDLDRADHVIRATRAALTAIVVVA